jgi:hypothetical protein
MSNNLRAILAGGFIAGTIDIGAAVALYHIGPITILQAIASGLLGKAAYSGGLNTVVLGLVLQWVMSLIIPRSLCSRPIAFPCLGGDGWRWGLPMASRFSW